LARLVSLNSSGQDLTHSLIFDERTVLGSCEFFFLYDDIPSAVFVRAICVEYTKNARDGFDIGCKMGHYFMLDANEDNDPCVRGQFCCKMAFATAIGNFLVMVYGM
jgi:hypothetical protein